MVMALIFMTIDPETDSDHCPAVFVEEETGDMLFQGWTVTDPPTLCSAAFEAVWARSLPHAAYQPT
jgi:hypothetical protein